MRDDGLWEEVDGSLDMIVVVDVWGRAVVGKVYRGVERDGFFKRSRRTVHGMQEVDGGIMVIDFRRSARLQEAKLLDPTL